MYTKKKKILETGETCEGCHPARVGDDLKIQNRPPEVGPEEL